VIRSILRVALGLSVMACLLLATHPPQLAAQQTPQLTPQQTSQQAGVLLSYGGIGDAGYQYKTMWIVFSSTEARVVATVPDVIVLRPTGFWRLGHAIVCEYDPGAERDTSRDVLWQTELAQAPVIEQGPPCKGHLVQNLRGDSGEDNLPSTGETAINLCGQEDAKLLFVSPGYIAEEFSDWDRCEVRGEQFTTRDDVRSIDGGAHLDLGEILGGPAAAAYSVAAKKGFRENSKSYNCPENDPADYDLKSWSIIHVGGAWHPAAALDHFMGDCAFSYPMDLTLPKSLTGEAAQGRQWPAVAGVIPKLSVFYLSPGGDYALILVSPKEHEYYLYAYATKSGVPSKRLAEIPWDKLNSHPIVMAQWAPGKYVATWSSVMAKIEETPLPGPTVRTPNSTSNNQ